MSTISRVKSSRATRPAPLPIKQERFELRSGESVADNAVTVTAGEPLMQLEVRQGSITLMDGIWNSQLRISGRDRDPVSSWKTICTERNEHCQYIELELAVEREVQIERQVFLARRDGFAFVADVVKCPSAATGDYCVEFPLPTAVSFQKDRETHDGWLLHCRSRVARIVPVCLPEWQREPGGDVKQIGSKLTLSLPLKGQRLHAAMFIDLDRRRMKLPVTWRNLAVAQALERVSPDLAVGYRVQIAKLQWLFYRSLGPLGNRSVLGQNFSTEFVAARFPTSGTADKMLEIE